MLVAVLTTTFCLRLASAQGGAAPEHDVYNEINDRYTTGQNAGSSPNVFDRHNYGYVPRKTREVQIATYEAKLMFHYQMPPADTEFDERTLDCSTNPNISLPCAQITRILEAVRDIRSRAQTHLQRLVTRIHDVLLDLPTGERRNRRGFLTDVLSKITGLASQDQLQAVRDILERIEGGIQRAAQMWGDGTRNLIGAFEIEQHRIDNVYSVLSVYQKIIQRIPVELVKTSHDTSGRTLFSKVIKLVSDTTFQVTEAEALYTAVQFLMAGRIPHFLLPHDVLAKSLEQVQNHLRDTERHMSLCRHDYSYYYNEASFKTFRAGNTLVLMINAPITISVLAKPFNIYDVIRLPLATPEQDSYYSILTTDIKIVGFHPDSELILQMTDGQPIPHADIWLLDNPGVTFIDRRRPTCALALISGNLRDIKTYCRYSILKSPYPRGVIPLFENSFLLTNISTLQMHCFHPNSSTGGISHIYKLTTVQSVHTFDCHCDVTADEFRIIVDTNQCNFSENIHSVFALKIMINLAFPSEYFDEIQLFNLSGDSFLNDSSKPDSPI